MPGSQRSRAGWPREPLRDWFAPRAVAYPWRRTTDPYAVLVSEVMLQQTQASRAAAAFTSFMDLFPSVGVLARATRGDVLRAWSGLGYNRRAVALHETAIAIVRDHAGDVPSDIGVLRSLPGVGPYTAAAVASIAFGAPVAAVDTNLRRIVARVVHGLEPDEVGASQLRADADALVDPHDPGAWNQALMDLGREVCRPRLPRCAACPLVSGCAFAAGAREARGSTRRQPAFEGSMRQVRGRVVAELRGRPHATVTELAHAVGTEPARVREAVTALVREGIVVTAGSEITVETRLGLDPVVLEVMP